MTEPAPFAAARSTVFAVLTVLLAVAAHEIGHGALPALPDVIGGLGLSILAARPLMRRERGLPALSLGVLGSQVALHVAFLGRHHTHGPALLPGRAMTLAHLLAGAALVGWLRWGEKALGALARGVKARLLLTRPRVFVPATAESVVARPALPRRPRSLVLTPATRRGPPVHVVMLAPA